MTAFLEGRRKRTGEAWHLDRSRPAGGNPTPPLVLVSAGQPILKPGKADQAYPFIPHSEYHYLTDRVRPGSVLAYDPEAGPADGWVDFVPPISQAEKLWEGGGDPAAVEGTRPVSELGDWLKAKRNGRPVVLLGSSLPGKLAEEHGLRSDAGWTECLREALNAVRRVKDDGELARIRRACQATAEGFRELRGHIRPGVTEHQLEVELAAAFGRAGADGPGYNIIVGTGPHAAVLHFMPGPRKLGDQEMVLIDAGAEIDGYTADVTRTYPAKAFTAEQRDLYQIVLEAEKKAIDRCRVGAEYREIHLAAARDLAQGLVDFGVLKGDPDSLVEQDAHALFFPHGIGHLVGHGVRDASGYLPGRERSERLGLANLRLDLPLGEDFVVTIEPGLYFIPAFLDDPAHRERFADAVNWDRADQLKDFGGIRIEDDIRVTPEGPENLTAEIPKGLDEL